MTKPPSSPSSELDLARTARVVAEQAGDLIRGAYGTGFRIEEKSSATDLVTEVDRASERLITRELAERAPGSSFLGEEHGAALGATSQGGESGIRWCIDPIDGTQNFVIGRPYFAVSIGIEREGELIGGAVHDPVHRTTYWATRDRAWQDETPLPTCADHPGFLGVNTGQPFQGLVPAREDLPELLDVLRALGPVRSPGSIALQITDVAVGRSAAAIELAGAAPWDIAGGFAIAQATGCTIRTLQDDIPGYGGWGAPSFLVLRGQERSKELASFLRGVLERGDVPHQFFESLAVMTR